MKKIRILRLIARLNIGGPAIQSILLADAFNKEEFESLLVSGAVEKGEAQMNSLLDKYAINTVFIPEFGREIRPIKDISTLIKVFGIMRKYRPHIVHTHTAKAGFIGRLAAFLARVPVRVHTFHGHTFYGYFSPFKNFVLLNIERLLSKITDRIITISPLQLADVTKKFKVADEKQCAVIPLGLELGDYLELASEPAGKEAIGFKAEDIIIGTVGRLTKVKNHKLFLEIASLFYSRHGETNVKFAIVGDGKLKNEITDLCDKFGLTDKVRIFGWQTDMARFYSAFDVFLLTSRNEGTPVSVIEALASSRPVVSSNVGGVADVLRDGETGYLVKTQDPKDFVVKIEQLIYNRETRISMGRKGRESVRDTFEAARLIRDLKKLYMELLNRKGART